MKTTPVRNVEMGQPQDTFMKVRNRLLVWSAFLLMSGAGTAGAAMLADFNDPATWSDGWNFQNYEGEHVQMTGSGTYEGYGALLTYYGQGDVWNNLTLNFAAQDWSTFSQLKIAAKTQDPGMTGSFGVKVLGPSGVILQKEGLSITNTWYDFAIDLGTVARTSVTGVNIYWNGTWSSASWRPFDFDTLEVVPEPASLALLAVGGLVLLRRRR